MAETLDFKICFQNLVCYLPILSDENVWFTELEYCTKINRKAFLAPLN